MSLALGIRSLLYWGRIQICGGPIQIPPSDSRMANQLHGPGGGREGPPRLGVVLCCLALTAAALVVRLLGIHWGLPYEYH